MMDNYGKTPASGDDTSSEEASTEDTFNAEGGMNDQDSERAVAGKNIEGDAGNTDQGGQVDGNNAEGGEQPLPE